MNDSLTIRRMQPADLPAALALSTEVGWNQSAADWQRMLHIEPDGCFVSECAGNVVGTTLCCLFGSVAWLAMVIVTPAFRGHGLGQRLVQAGLEYAEQHGMTSIGLDATPLGEVVYRRVGFQPQFELLRLTGVATAPSLDMANRSYEIVTASAYDLDAILKWDRRAVRSDRAKLLSRLCQETPPWIAKSPDGQMLGFLARRPGRVAEQLGPCCAAPEVSGAFLSHALTGLDGKNVIVDIPADRADLLAAAREFGLTVQRTLLRMCRGPAVTEDPAFFHISYGGEFG